MFGQATDDGRPDALRIDLTLRQVVEPAPGAGRGIAAIVLLTLAVHLALLAGVAWLERVNPPEVGGGAVEIPVEMVAEAPQQMQEAAAPDRSQQARSPQAAVAPDPPRQDPASPQAPETGPARPDAAAQPGGMIVERPAESSLPQEARKRGVKSDADPDPRSEAKPEAKPDTPTENPPQETPDAKKQQLARANPFGGLSPVQRTPEAERAPAFLAPQSFLEQARPRPAPDATNDNYRARALGQVAAAMLEPERPRPKALAIVGFTVDDAGGLASAWLVRPSGHADLDAEAMDMVRRAAPFPPPPGKTDRNFAAAIAFGGD